MIQFESDFPEDFAREVREMLKGLNFHDPGRLKPYKACRILAQLSWWRFDEHPRAVEYSQYLKDKLPSLSESTRRGLRRRADDAAAGRSLREHLSNTLLDSAKSHDHCFSRWGIHHFHLGQTAKDRDDERVYAMLFQDRILFVDVLRHDEESQELLQIVHDNWYEVLDNVRVRKGEAILPLPRVTMRDGTVYYEPGGGVVRGKNRGLSYAPPTSS